MSFPTQASPPGDPGGARRGFVLGSDEGDPYWWLGTLSINKLTGDRTGGGVDIVDHRVPPGYSPPTHIHQDQDEVFFVLDGDFSVRCGDDHLRAGPGSLVFLPRGVPHGFTAADSGGRTLLVNAPAGFADVIRELGTQPDGLELPGKDVATPDAEQIATVSEAHGIHNA